MVVLLVLVVIVAVAVVAVACRCLSFVAVDDVLLILLVLRGACCSCR